MPECVHLDESIWTEIEEIRRLRRTDIPGDWKTQTLAIPRSSVMTNEEKRTYPRLTLGLGDGFFGSFTSNGGETLVAQIMTISAGGLNMAVAEKAAGRLTVGERLFLLSIAGGTNFSFLNHIKTEIRWAKRLDKPGYVSVGCRFLDLSEAVREQLVQFVDAERIARGQYD
jgi:c-di-GMP-binding flagellar brake protein YcgR